MGSVYMGDGSVHRSGVGCEREADGATAERDSMREALADLVYAADGAYGALSARAPRSIRHPHRFAAETLRASINTARALLAKIGGAS